MEQNTYTTYKAILEANGFEDQGFTTSDYRGKTRQFSHPDGTVIELHDGNWFASTGRSGSSPETMIHRLRLQK